MAQANGSGNTTTANLMVEDVKYAKRNRKNLYVSLPELQSSQLFEVFAVRDDLQVRSAERARREKNPAADLVRGARAKVTPGVNNASEFVRLACETILGIPPHWLISSD